MRRVRALVLPSALRSVASVSVACLVTCLVACAVSCTPPPPPTSTTPATPGSAAILPSPSRAESVPRDEGDAPTPPPAEASQQPSATPSSAPSVKF